MRTTMRTMRAMKGKTITKVLKASHNAWGFVCSDGSVFTIWSDQRPLHVGNMVIPGLTLERKKEKARK